LSTFTRWLQQLDAGPILDTVIVVIAALFCIIIHEISHGLAAYWMGDHTAKQQGRLSLNPLRHIDPIGLIVMAIAGFGWAKPVAIDPRRFRNPKLGMAATALAGPVSNLILTLLVMIVLRVAFRVEFLFFFGEIRFYCQLQSPVLQFIAELLVYVALLSTGLAIFNLFPIPPLDGSKVLFAVLPDRYYFALMRYEHYGMILLVVLLLTGVLDGPLDGLRSGLFEQFWNISGLLTGA